MATIRNEMLYNIALVSLISVLMILYCNLAQELQTAASSIALSSWERSDGSKEVRSLRNGTVNIDNLIQLIILDKEKPGSAAENPKLEAQSPTTAGVPVPVPVPVPVTLILTGDQTLPLQALAPPYNIVTTTVANTPTPVVPITADLQPTTILPETATTSLPTTQNPYPIPLPLQASSPVSSPVTTSSYYYDSNSPTIFQSVSSMTAISPTMPFVGASSTLATVGLPSPISASQANVPTKTPGKTRTKSPIRELSGPNTKAPYKPVITKAPIPQLSTPIPPIPQSSKPKNPITQKPINSPTTSPTYSPTLTFSPASIPTPGATLQPGTR
jgi:hypothetical protein